MKPCPFCGKDRGENYKIKTIGHRAQHWVECRYCRARGPIVECEMDIAAPRAAELMWDERAAVRDAGEVVP